MRKQCVPGASPFFTRARDEAMTFGDLHVHVVFGMSDVQNFFHEVLAVIIAKIQYLYTRRKLSVSSIECYHFPVEVQCVRKLRPFLFFPIQISIERKCDGALLVLHRLERHKYFREGHSVGQTVV